MDDDEDVAANAQGIGGYPAHTDADTPPCGGPDRCDDDLCRGEDVGICGEPSMRSLGLDDSDDPWVDLGGGMSVRLSELMEDDDV